jgi:membrane protein DedA with SNARE-associated domain
VLNRFMPSFRAVVFVAAGASGTPLPRVLLLGGLSALAWNALLLGVGDAIGAKADKLEDWLSQYRLVAIVVTAVVVLVLVARWALRRRKPS